MITLLLLVHATYIQMLFLSAYPVCGEFHIQRHADQSCNSMTQNMLPQPFHMIVTRMESVFKAKVHAGYRLR